MTRLTAGGYGLNQRARRRSYHGEEEHGHDGEIKRSDSSDQSQRKGETVDQNRSFQYGKFVSETDEYMIFGWIGATGFYFGFIFGLRVIGVVYMGYCVMRSPSLYHLFPHPSPPFKFSCDQPNVSSETTCEPAPPSHHHQPPLICAAVSLKPQMCVSHSNGDTFVSQRFLHVLSRGEEMSYTGSMAEDSKRNRDPSCTAKVIDVASWPSINLGCCDAQTVPTSLSVKAKRLTKTEAFKSSGVVILEPSKSIRCVLRVSEEPVAKYIEVIWVLADHGDVILCVGRRPVHWVWCMLRHSLVDLLCQGFNVDKSSTGVCYRAHIRWCLWPVRGQRVCTSLGPLFDLWVL
uniref:Uncharacterized protein n=1 Tax=Brassica campestris TaxID=3711 RepID=M4EYF0_BRACM